MTRNDLQRAILIDKLRRIQASYDESVASSGCSAGEHPSTLKTPSQCPNCKSCEWYCDVMSLWRCFRCGKTVNQLKTQNVEVSDR